MNISLKFNPFLVGEQMKLASSKLTNTCCWFSVCYMYIYIYIYIYLLHGIV